jgi:hypothetical protein
MAVVAAFGCNRGARRIKPHVKSEEQWLRQRSTHERAVAARGVCKEPAAMSVGSRGMLRVDGANPAGV